MTKKKMGSMSSLRKLSGIKPQQPEETAVTPEPSSPEPLVKEENAVSEVASDTSAVRTEVINPKTPEIEDKQPEVIETKAKVEEQTLTTKKQEKLVKVNINIRKDQKDWLAETASQVRENNLNPVPPSERVYPQHLIGVAIDLLQAAGVDWGEVRNVEELRERLNL
ncbi:hypothetical protein IQ238_14440 [Pleurocapsales cyanobacterium LEGE 06147]|nr:hypothetical protein [Pleurocapsales cyanobacterium LEGE 06147]